MTLEIATIVSKVVLITAFVDQLVWVVHVVLVSQFSLVPLIGSVSLEVYLKQVSLWTLIKKRFDIHDCTA